MPNKPPDVIYLQVHGADKGDLAPGDITDYDVSWSDVTWCVDRIYDTDLEYKLVRRSLPRVKARRTQPSQPCTSQDQ